MTPAERRFPAAPGDPQPAEDASPWWQGAVIYQLYVRSWRDSNGDGYGDLPGVIEGLDYLVWLGADGVWLSPTMPSPDDDWGYDVSDYLGVHPELGTLEDLDRLVAEAARRGMRVLLDLVPNHTSSAHPWFVEARSARDSPLRDYYVWADPAPGGGPPNNWLDSTGEPAWTFDATTGQYYLHNFLETQPDLNWWEPAVHREFEQILRFWLGRGVAGFRIDVAHGLYKDAELRDDPPAPPGDPLHRDLLPVYSSHRPEVHAVYRRWREIAEERKPPALLLGETWVGTIDELARYYGDDDELQLAFNFRFVFARLEAAEIGAVVDETLSKLPPGACPVWTASNHDISRFPTRWCEGEPARVRLALTLLLTLPGTVVLYYGDEIGMADVEVPLELQRDEMTRAGRGRRHNRDRARTPMPWEPVPSGGFTASGVRPWLPLGDTTALSVAAQRDDPASTLSLTRRLLEVRRLYLAPGVAPFGWMRSGAEQLVYRCGRLVVAANLSSSPAEVGGLPARLACSSRPDRDLAAPGPRPASGTLVLDPWEAVVASDDVLAVSNQGSGAGTLGDLGVVARDRPGVPGRES